MWVSEDRLVDAVTVFLLTVRNVESECSFRDAIDLSHKMSALIVKKILAIGDQELEVTDLW